MLRPVIAILFFESIRTNLTLIAHDFRDSLVIMFTMFVFILFFAAIGLFMFQGTFAGSQDFNDFASSYYSFVCLLTDTNFPDLMLLPYYQNTWYTLYFITFVIGAIFLLSNMLTAVIFDNYQKRIEQKAAEKVGTRRQHVEKIYNQFDTEAKGYLTIS